jgi:hypothetical protein
VELVELVEIILNPVFTTAPVHVMKRISQENGKMVGDSHAQRSFK